jgi:serine/threonine protein kinase
MLSPPHRIDEASPPPSTQRKQPVFELGETFLRVNAPNFKEGTHIKYRKGTPIPFLQIRSPGVEGRNSKVCIVTIPASHLDPDKHHPKDTLYGQYYDEGKFGEDFPQLKRINLVQKEIGSGPAAEAERELFKEFRHDCIVPLYCSYQLYDSVLLLFPEYECTLTTFWTRGESRKWTLEKSIHALYLLFEALGSIHEVQNQDPNKGFTNIGSHNDLKPDNNATSWLIRVTEG